jgi:ketosteroid isomerase-like protein
MRSAKVATPDLEDVIDAFNAHDVDAVMSFFTEDCVLDMPRGPGPGGRRLVGREQVREGIQSRFDGIPDVHYGDASHWVCGDRGVSEWTLSGTQRTGERIEVRGCDLFHFADGRISRKDSYWKIVD